MAQFDEIVKYLMAMFAYEFAKLSFGTHIGENLIKLRSTYESL